MGVMDKFLNIMKIGTDVDDDEYYDDEDDGYTPEKPQVRETQAAQQPVEQPKSRPAETRKPQPRKRTAAMNNDSSVCSFKPKSSEDAREIVETLLDGTTVVLNFEGVDIASSQRVLDIVTGACFAIDGKLQKISNYVFIATPSSVDVSGEFQDNFEGL